MPDTLPRVRVARPGRDYEYECDGCGDAWGTWAERADVMDAATAHARTCPALILARLRGELERAVGEWREVADLPSTTGYHRGIDYANRACADDLDAILARLP